MKSKYNQIINLYILLFFFMFSCSTSQPFYPDKHPALSIEQYETFTKKLKLAHNNEDNFRIAFELANLEAPKHIVSKYLVKSIDLNRQNACESIYETQRLANLGFYNNLYKYDTLIFQKAYNKCLNELGENSFILHMENYRANVKEVRARLPQIDSTKMDTALIKSLTKIRDDDQMHRKKLHAINISEDERKKYLKLQEKVNVVNLEKVDSILAFKSFPKPANVGHDLSRVIFLVLEHQTDVNTRKKYRSVIEQNYTDELLYLYDTGTADMQNRQTTESMAEKAAKCLKESAIDEFEAVVDGVRKKITSHDAKEDCILGSVLPTFEAVDLKDQNINNQSLVGKVSIINFWFTQCRPCIKEMPFLNTLVDKYQDHNVNFVAINRDSATKTKSLLDKHEFNFQIITDGEELIKKTFNMIWPYPFTIVTNKQNKVVGAFSAFDNEKKQNEILQLIEENL